VGAPVSACVSVSIAVDGLASQLRIALRPRHLAQYLHVASAPLSRPLRYLFEAAAMRVVDKGLMAMKVAELKEELEARGEGRTGNKAWLRRRLHAAIVREYLESM
jgi:hypothetical protein